MLEPYVAGAGVPPANSAGAWHLGCLAGDPVAEQWGQAHVHSFVRVRRFDLVARVPEWTVVDNPRTGDRLALGRLGAILALRGRGITAVPEGLRVSVFEYWLEWDQLVIARVQAELRNSGIARVLEVAGLLGIGDRLTKPETLAHSVFRVNPELLEEWTPTAVGAALDVVMVLPPELRSLC
jgi:hypothetical protein